MSFITIWYHFLLLCTPVYDALYLMRSATTIIVCLLYSNLFSPSLRWLVDAPDHPIPSWPMGLFQFRYELDAPLKRRQKGQRNGKNDAPCRCSPGLVGRASPTHGNSAFEHCTSHCNRRELELDWQLAFRPCWSHRDATFHRESPGRWRRPGLSGTLRSIDREMEPDRQPQRRSLGSHSNAAPQRQGAGGRR